MAAIRFAYKNKKVIKLLHKRGALIGADKPFEETEKVDSQINQCVEDNHDLIVSPVAAFVTFTTQEAKERAMMYLCKENEDGSYNDDYDAFISNGQEMVVMDAPEPSNIIWENV